MGLTAMAVYGCVGEDEIFDGGEGEVRRKGGDGV